MDLLLSYRLTHKVLWCLFLSMIITSQTWWRGELGIQKKIVCVLWIRESSLQRKKNVQNCLAFLFISLVKWSIVDREEEFGTGK